MSTATTLNSLRQIRDRADLILQNHFVYLKTYWNGAQAGFHANEENVKADRVNVTSTCFCLFAILPNVELASRFTSGQVAPGGAAEPLMPIRVARTLLAAPWQSENLGEFNIYTTPIAVRTLYKVLESPEFEPEMLKLLGDATNKKKLTKGLTAILEKTSDGAARFPPYEPSGYLTYWSFRALRSEARHKLVDGDLARRCGERAHTLASWAEREVHRHIAYDAAQDAASFDATQLAYALRIYAQYQTEERKPLNQKIVAKAIDVIASHQMADGLWPKAHPIFHYQTRGNVYTFSFELIDVILSRALPARLFQSYLQTLERSVDWVEQNRIETDSLKGWRSNHLPGDGGPEAWSTAAVLIALRRIRGVIVHRLNDEVLEQFRAQRMTQRDDTPLSPDKFYDCELPGTPPISLKAQLQKYLIRPHVGEGSKADRRYSAVFFGPPGTAKTTLAEAVARGLGWPYIYLQTSDFAGEGVNQVIGKARDIFSRLALLERAVILFDEVEEFVRDRAKEKSAESRLITTSMLSFIQELRGKESTIFIVATNFLDKFDSAITRAGGRFDLMLLVAPPSKTEKQRMFRDRLLKREQLKGDADALCAEFNAFVDQCYAAEAQYFAFSEWTALIKEALEAVEKSRALFQAELTNLLDRHKGGIAIRDKLRRDYEASRKFVRV